MWAASHNYRPITTLEVVLRLTLQMRRCLNANCSQGRTPSRPEAEGRLALPTPAFGLDVIAFVGTQRFAPHRSIPDIPHALVERGVAVAQRTVTTLLERDDALLSLPRQDTERLCRLPKSQGRVIFALDGLQPDMGHAVRWVLRDGLSGEVRLAHSVLSASHTALAALLQRGKHAVSVPLVAVVSDGQPSRRQAVPQALPQPPHPLGHFHSRREAATPIYAADRQAKKARKKPGRGVRPIARQCATRSAPEADVIRGYWSAVRRALPDDGRPPFAAAGRKLPQRLSAIADALTRVDKRGRYPRRSNGSRLLSKRHESTLPPVGPRGEQRLNGSSVSPTGCKMSQTLMAPA